MFNRIDGQKPKRGLFFALPLLAAPILVACNDAVTIAEWPDADDNSSEADAGTDAADEDAGPSTDGGDVGASNRNAGEIALIG